MNMAEAPSASIPGKELRWALWTTVAAFGTYFCMYGLRKPFTAASFDGAYLGPWGFKEIVVLAQVAGYMVSKFLGIKIIAEMPPHRRARTIVGLVLVAELALLGFALAPRPWNIFFLFLNGLPLGMVFGLVLGFLEGRRATEALTAGLCASFIVADGVTKSVGAWLLLQGITEDWMPCIAGLLFLLPLFLGTWMLAQVPAPNGHDVAARAPRAIMTRLERWTFFWRYGPGLSVLVLMYLLVTIVRSLRADFAPEIWRGLGAAAQPATFARSEIPVMLGVLLVNGGAACIRDNRWAFFSALATGCAGFFILVCSLLAWEARWISPFYFMVCLGLGLYLPYVAMHTTIFERLLAMTRDRGNIGFLMYVADSIGYLGYVAVLLGRTFWSGNHQFVGFFLAASWLVGVLSLLCMIFVWYYFAMARPATHPLQQTK